MAQRSIKFTPEIKKKINDMACEGKLPDEIAKEIGVTKRMLYYRAVTELRTGWAVARHKGIALPPRLGSASNASIDLSPSEKETIQELAKHGLTVEAIASIMGIGKMTLVAHWQEEIDKGRALGHKAVAETLFEMATSKNHPTMTTFYLKTKCGWKEATQIEFPDENGVPQSITGPVNLTLSAEKMQTLIALINEKV